MDEIGCLVMGKEFGAWWLGTSLDIEETRKMIDIKNNNISVSTIQAAGSIVSAIIYAIKNPKCGICFVDDIDYEEYSKIADMFQGPINSCEVKSDAIKKIVDSGCQFEDYGIDLNVL
jgi:homospermidine synthase